MTDVRRNIIFGFLLVAFIIVFEIILARLQLPAWPAFMVMILFFVVHENAAMTPHILIGGSMGIVCFIACNAFIAVVESVIGAEAAKLTFIGLFVYAIVLFNDVVPYVFNSFAFMFFLVSFLAAAHPNASPPVWIGVELVVGGIFIAGTIGISRLTEFIL